MGSFATNRLQPSRTASPQWFESTPGFEHCTTTRQYAQRVSEWIGSIGLNPRLFGTHSLRRTKATLIYRRTGNLRAVQLLPGHTKIESTVRYLGIEVDDALAIAEQDDVYQGRADILSPCSNRWFVPTAVSTSMPGLRSRPITLSAQPTRCAASRAIKSVPHAMSNTRSPGCGSKSATTSGEHGGNQRARTSQPHFQLLAIELGRSLPLLVIAENTFSACRSRT